MDYKYYLPNETNQPEEYATHSNSVVIIGAKVTGIWSLYKAKGLRAGNKLVAVWK